MPSHKITTTWENVGANERVDAETTVTADGAVIADIAVAADAEDAQADLSIVAAQLKSLYIKSTTGVTIKTNDAETPDDTITLLAGQALQWDENSPHANPFSADVTALYITENDSADGELTIRSLQDFTP